MLWINFKTYERGLGDRGLSLARLCEEISQETGTPIAVCPQMADLYRLGQQVNVELWAQHVDGIEMGKHTGFLLPEAAMHAGASGVLINHSEHPLSFEVVGQTINRCQDVGLSTMIFASSVAAVEDFAPLQPDYLAFEPPSLVGGDRSVAELEREEIRGAVLLSPNSKLVVGAGVHSLEDVTVSLRQGAYGVLVSSAVMEKTEDPSSLIHELASGFADFRG